MELGVSNSELVRFWSIAGLGGSSCCEFLSWRDCFVCLFVSWLVGWLVLVVLVVVVVVVERRFGVGLVFGCW